MGNTQLPPIEVEGPPLEVLPPPQAEQQMQPEPAENNKKLIFIIVTAVVLLVLLCLLAISFLLLPSTPTDKIRDVLIIFVAIETGVIGVALVVLIVQIASLTNLLQNEVKPILMATKETVNTLRGTTEFLGENIVEPVIKLQGYLAGLIRMLELLGVRRK